MELTKTGESWENYCNGGISSQNLNDGSRTKSHRENTLKRIASSYEPQGAVEVVINPGTFCMCDVNFDISVGKHKRDLLMGFFQITMSQARLIGA